MRCKFCGWPNPEHINRCQKCGNPTGVNEDTVALFEEGGDNGDDKKTVMIKRGQGGGVPSEKRRCPNCSYPLLNSMTVCPQCKYELNSDDFRISGRHVEAVEEQKTALTGTYPDNAEDKKTFNPYVNKKESRPVVKGFSLTPIMREGEESVPGKGEFSGASVILNRQNTEPANSSITGKTQAVVTCEDGRWFIEDKSSQKTTFVCASRKTPLQDGDIILLGNRMFQFHETKQTQ